MATTDIQVNPHKRIGYNKWTWAGSLIRTALRALDRQDAALNEYLRANVQASLSDPRPSVPAGDVFRRLRARHARRVKASKHGG
jgi:antitoxin ParD1/3/4